MATGDINGDGVDDFIVSAIQAEVSGSNIGDRGVVYVRYGDSNLKNDFSLSEVVNDSSKGFVIYGEKASDYIGVSLDIADINGDGVKDIIIGAPYATPSNSGVTWAGMTCVVFGKHGVRSGINIAKIAGNSSLGFCLYGSQDSESAGYQVKASDVNNDNKIDLIIAAYTGDNSDFGYDQGQVYIFYGKDGIRDSINLSSIGNDNTLGFVISGKDSNDYIGISLAIADVNDDGIKDIIIGASSAEVVADLDDNRGVVYILYGTTNQRTSLNIGDIRNNNLLGFVIDGQDKEDGPGGALDVGDIDNDGINDIIIGSPRGGDKC